MRRLASIALALGCLAVAGLSVWSIFGQRADSLARAPSPEETASISPAAKTLGPSGLPIPRFVSLKAEKVNVRRGPSSDHPVAWVFQRKGLPVEIVAEFENWRRIRDSEGEEGWILQNMLSGKRMAMIAPWRSGQKMAIYAEAKPASRRIALLASGVIGEIATCTGAWCEVTAGGYEGWIEQSMLWGVYPGEPVE